jgi:multidrug efflux pump subunit AcrA (membrane-fusion protein)
VKRLPWIVGIALAVGAIVWSLGRPAKVVVVRATRGPAIAAVYATGTVEADPRVTVKARVPGTVAALLVKEGDRVKAGQLLARLDNKALAYDLQRTRADVRASTLRTAGASPQLAALTASRQSIAVDLKLAESELTRAEALEQKGAMARDELDRRRERVEKLKAEWAAAGARIASMQIDLRADRERAGAVEGAMAAQNADTEVRAPEDGTVIRKSVELGEAVVVSEPLFVVGDTDHLILEVKIDEADVGRVRVGQPVLVDLYAFAKENITGKVSELYPDADRDTKTFLAKVELDRPPEGLRSGMSAEVNIVTARHEHAVLVPAGAVSGDRLFVVDGGRARSRAVEVGLKDTRNAEIVSGVKPGDEVVLVGPDRLTDGERVSASEGKPPETARAPHDAMTVR